MNRSLLSVLALVFFASLQHSQITTGSDGSDGAFNPTVDTVIDLSLAPTVASWTSGGKGNGVAATGVYDSDIWAVVFKYSSVDIPSGVDITFVNHPTRAPVVWLVDGTVTISGTVLLNGQGGLSSSFTAHAEPGPGGFRGGLNAYQAGPGEWASSSGFGPGGGYQHPTSGFASSGGGSHATAGLTPITTPDNTYGYSGVFPLIGGSGGAAMKHIGSFANAFGGGAGGGAILIAADDYLVVQGQIKANGGEGRFYDGPQSMNANTGSGAGGAIRLVSYQVELAGGAIVQALGGSSNYDGGDGRIRIESALPIISSIAPSPMPSYGTPQALLPVQATPKIWISSVDGQAVSLDPRAGLGLAGQEADLDLSLGGSRVIVIETENLPDPATTELYLRLTRASGSLGAGLSSVFEYSVTNGGSNPLQLTGQPNGHASVTFTIDLEPGYTCLQARATF